MTLLINFTWAWVACSTEPERNSAFACAAPVPRKGIVIPGVSASGLLPTHVYPHKLSALPYTCKQSIGNLPRKGLVIVSRGTNPIKLVILLQIFLAGRPFSAIFALKAHVLNYIMAYKLNAISNLNLYKCQLSSSLVSPMRLPTAVLESALLCRHCISYSMKLLLKE